MFYYIDNADNTFDILNNGIKKFHKENCANNEQQAYDLFMQKLSNYMPSIFRVDADNIEFVEPYELGISNKFANALYDIHKISSEIISQNMIKIAENLIDCNNEDLYNYLTVVIKVASNKKYKTYQSVINSLPENKKDIFKKAYNKSLIDANKENLDNAENIAIITALYKIKEQ